MSTIRLYSGSGEYDGYHSDITFYPYSGGSPTIIATNALIPYFWTTDYYYGVIEFNFTGIGVLCSLNITEPTPTPTPTSTPTSTPTPTSTSTPTPTPTATSTPTPTPTATIAPEGAVLDILVPSGTPSIVFDGETFTSNISYGLVKNQQYTISVDDSSGNFLYWSGTGINLPAPSTSFTVVYVTGSTATLQAVFAQPTPTPTPTSTPTPTPTESPLDFSIGSSCDAGGTYYTYNHTGGSGQYDRSSSENSTESEALTTTQWFNVPNPNSYVTMSVGVPNITKTYWVAVRDRNNPSNIVAKSILVDCAPTPTPTPTSTPTPTPTAQPSGLIVTISEVGSDVIMSGSGSLNVTGLIEGSVQTAGGINGTLGYWVIGQSNLFFARKFFGSNLNVYPNSFGSGYTAPTSYSGDTFGIQNGSLGKDIILPLGYTSGSPLNGTATFANKTISSMGLIPGTYLYSWGSDSITLQIGS